MKIKAAENGPYLLEVTEAKVIRNGKEEVLSQKTIALCRCGQSSSKPFCDGAHKKCEFKGEVVEIDVR
ncbi:MAG: CDGSH iron-sulfur domain-containing protein [Ignavibacteriales bacterium]